MGIAKEIFGLEKREETSKYGEIWLEKAYAVNDIIDAIDAFEISEEAIAIILQDITYKSGSGYKTLDANATREVAKSIKANANKIFVRKEQTK